MKTPDHDRMMRHEQPADTEERRRGRGRPRKITARVRCSHCGHAHQPAQRRTDPTRGIVDLRCPSCGSIFRMRREHYDSLSDGDVIATRRH